MSAQKFDSSLFFLTLFFGVLLIGFAAVGPMYGLIESPKAAWFTVVIGAALIGAGWAIGSRCPSFAALLAALFLGGGAQLWMTEPLWFPALRFSPEGTADLIMIALIGLQGAITLYMLLTTNALAAIGRFFSAFGVFRIVLFLILSTLFLISPLGYLSYGGFTSYATHLIAAAIMMCLNLATVAAMLRVPAPSMGPYTFSPLVPALFAFAYAVGLSWFAFESMPHVEDEVAFLFQARTMAGGALSVPAPPEATIPGLEYYLLEVRDGRWLATTPPGWTGLLAIGVLIGAPWLLNPLLAFAAVLLAHNIVLRLADRTQANLVAILMAASPWFLGTSASLMPHNIALALTLFAWWALLQNRRFVMWALLGGIAMGWIVVTRQLEGLILGTLTGIWLLTRVRNIGLIPIITYGLGCVIGASFYLGFNAALTGDPLLDPLARYLNDSWGKGANGYGFGPDIGPPGGWGALDLEPGHSPFEAFINAVNNLSALSIEFLGWGTASLALFWAYVLLCKPNRLEAAQLIIAASVIAALSLYWFSGSFYIGPRYWFSAFFPLLIFSASGFRALQSRLSALGVPENATNVVFLVLCVFSVSVFTTWRGFEKYHEYGEFTSDPLELSVGLSNAVIFFDPETIDAGSAFSLNDPWMRENRPIFIRDLGAAINTEVVRAFPGRTIVYLGKEN